MHNIELLNSVLTKRKEGKSYGEIAKNFNITKSTVQYMLKYRKNMKKKTGPKEKISKNDKRRIRSLVTDMNKNQTKVSCGLLNETLQLHVHRTTVLRTLRCMNYNYQNLPSKLKLSYHVKQKRVQFAKDCIINNVNWNKVIFSDEKRFSLYGCDSYQSWIHTNESKVRVKKVLKSPGIMIWAMLLPNGLISFRRLRGKQNSECYVKILREIVIPIAKMNLEPGFIYQHDNCPIHVSRVTKKYCNDSGLNVMDWPAHSPDINIIENLWWVISEGVYKRGPIKNLKELELRITETVNNLNETKREIINSLYGSIKKRLCEVIYRRGEKTKY